MWRNFTYSIVVIFTLFVFWQFGVFAQSSEQDCSTLSVCQVTPAELTLLLDFTRALLQTIQTVWTEWKYLWSYVNPDRFVGGSFRPPQQNIADKTTTYLWQKLDYLLATTAIFTSPQQIGWLKDIFAWITVLFKPRVFSRDLQLVEKLDAEITQKRYELWLGWWWNHSVRIENKQLFQNILDAYKTKWLLSSDSRISGELTYTAITTLAGRIVSILKDFLSSHSSQGLRSLLDARWISLSLDSDLVQGLESQYACVRTTNIWSSLEQSFLQSMQRIGTDALEKIQLSMKTFSDAAKRLTSLSSWSPREDTLLTDYHWGYYSDNRLDYSFDDGWWLSRRRSTVQNTAWLVKNIFDSSSSTASPDTTSLSVSSSITSLDNWLLTRMKPLMQAQSRDLSLVNFSETKDFSWYFDALGKKIFTLKQLLWNKDAQWSLINELWQACELQYGNLSKKCR